MGMRITPLHGTQGPRLLCLSCRRLHRLSSPEDTPQCPYCAHPGLLRLHTPAGPFRITATHRRSSPAPDPRPKRD